MFTSFQLIYFHVLSSDEFNETPVALKALSCRAWISFSHRMLSNLPLQRSRATHRSRVLLVMCVCWFIVSAIKISVKKCKHQENLVMSPQSNSEATNPTQDYPSGHITVSIPRNLCILKSRKYKTASFMEESTPTTSPVQVETGVRAPLWRPFGSVMFELAEAWRKGATLCGILQHVHSEGLLKVSFLKLQHRCTRVPTCGRGLRSINIQAGGSGCQQDLAPSRSQAHPGSVLGGCATLHDAGPWSGVV